MGRCNWEPDGADGVLGDVDKEQEENKHRSHCRPELNLHEFNCKNIRHLGDFITRERVKVGEKGMERW